MRNPLSLRRLRHARNRPPQNGKPTPHPAHTAGGRSISGLWEWFERVVLMATLISIGLGTWAFLIDYEDRKQARAVNAATLEEIKASQIARELERKVNEATLAEIEDSRETRRNEAIARAWSLLTTPATGNSGKREALEYLAGQGVSLTGIDLSCAKMGGGWDDKKKCETPVYLAGLTLEAPAGQRVDLQGAHLEGANLVDAHLEGVDLGEAHLERANLVRAHLQGTILSEAHLEGAHLWAAHLERADLRKTYLQGAYLMQTKLIEADLSRAQMAQADLSTAHLERADLSLAQLGRAILWEAHLDGSDLFGANLGEADLWEAHLERANLEEAHREGAHLSLAHFNDARNIDKANFTNSWAWADKPPIGLPATIPVTLCRYQDGMDRSTRPEPCLPPV